MTETSWTDLEPQRQKLLKRKLGTLVDWRVPELVHCIGPRDPTPFISFAAKQRDVLNACLARIETYSDQDVSQLITERGDGADIIVPFWRSFLTDEIQRLDRTVPPWFAGGFGHPDYVADFEYWAKMPRFSVDEITCLSIGIGPEAFPADKIQSLLTAKAPPLWPALQFLLRRREQLERQFDPGLRGWTVQPPDFMSWGDRVGFETHPEFLRMLRNYHRPVEVSPLPLAIDQPRTNIREIDTMSKLFVALVIQEFGYVPNQKRSPIPKQIVDMCEQLGLQMSDDTVRTYLRRGAGFLPEDWKPE